MIAEAWLLWGTDGPFPEETKTAPAAEKNDEPETETLMLSRCLRCRVPKPRKGPSPAARPGSATSPPKCERACWHARSFVHPLSSKVASHYEQEEDQRAEATQKACMASSELFVLHK